MCIDIFKFSVNCPRKAVNRIDAAFLYELADLERIVSDGRALRETEAEAGRTIVAAEVAAFQAGRIGRAAVPRATTPQDTKARRADRQDLLELREHDCTCRGEWLVCAHRGRPVAVDVQTSLLLQNFHLLLQTTSSMKKCLCER